MLLTQPQSICELIEGLPKRFTASDRLKNFAKEHSLYLINELKSNATPFLKKLGVEGVYETNTTDGLRITLSNGDMIHLRPSGNAPELRCYCESTEEYIASSNVKKVLGLVKDLYYET
jgi:phosphomannomutase